ncbi:MAG: hypothetical protein ACPL4H_03650 [Anaerolineales bacterium]
MTRRKNLNDLCRRRLGDLFPPNEFSDLQINQWINDAIADYSLYLPRQFEYRISTVAGKHIYPLESIAGLRNVLSVAMEREEGEALYLARRSEREQCRFWEQAVYDLKRDNNGQWQLVIGLTSPGAETICLVVEADHVYLSGDEDETTVPDLHLEWIVLFVRAAALQAQLAKVSAQNDPSSLLLSSLGNNAERAISEYQQKKKEILAATNVGGVIQLWEG